MHRHSSDENNPSLQRSNPRQSRSVSQKPSLHLWRRAIRTSALIVVIISIYGLSFLSTGSAPAAYAVANGQSMTPLMGLSSWNAHFANINESVIKASVRQKARHTLASGQLPEHLYWLVTTSQRCRVARKTS